MQRIGIKSIEKLENIFDKYDLEVEDNHNFFANDILVHNCRALAIIDHSGDVTLMSRAGKEFTTLDKIKQEIESFNLKNLVFDGEVCLVDENGDEDFQSIIKEIRRKDHTIDNPKYKVFDVMDFDSFTKGKGSKLFSERYEEINSYLIDAVYSERIEQIKIKDMTHLLEMADAAVSDGWEGLIIRKDVGYEGKRTKNMLKVKKFFDDEYVVKDVEMGPFRVIVDGKEVTEEMLSAVMIEHKGNVVGVGSGFSIEDRRRYYSHPEEIIGKTMTVQYFEESRDKDGNYSLRFPTVKTIYEDGRDM